MADDEMDYIPHADALAIVEGDIGDFLPSRIWDTLLDLILAWAEFNTALAFLVASISGLNPDEGADKYGRARRQETEGRC